MRVLRNENFEESRLKTLKPWTLENRRTKISTAEDFLVDGHSALSNLKTLFKTDDSRA